MCRSQYHGVLRGGRLLGLGQPASASCYNYPPLKGDVRVPTAAPPGEFGVVLRERNAGCTAASAQSGHLGLLSLGQSNRPYSAQLSVSWLRSSRPWPSLNQRRSSQLTHRPK